MLPCGNLTFNRSLPNVRDPIRSSTDFGYHVPDLEFERATVFIPDFIARSSDPDAVDTWKFWQRRWWDVSKVFDGQSALINFESMAWIKSTVHGSVSPLKDQHSRNRLRVVMVTAHPSYATS